MKTIIIPTHKLMENMIIAIDILNDQGSKLISEGYKVRTPEKVISLLEKHKIQTVEIIIPKENPQIPIDIILGSQINPLIHTEKDFPVPDTKDMLLKNTLEEEIVNFKQIFPSTKQRIYSDFNEILYGKKFNHQKLKEHTKENLEIFNLRTNIFQLIEIMRKIDDSIYTHCYNVALTSYIIGKWINLCESDLEELFLAAILTDIGKLKIPKMILDKKDNFTNKEQLELDKHVIYSYNLINHYTTIPDKVKKAVLTHHEKMDGTGYPFRLKAADIPLYSRIIAISDVYNTLITKDFSKSTAFDAIKHMQNSYSHTLDLNILCTFLNRIGNCFIGQKIMLANKEIGEIIFINNGHINKPIIKLASTNELMDLNRYKAPWVIKDFVT